MFTSTTSKSGNRPSPGVCLDIFLEDGRVSSDQPDTYYIGGRQENPREAEIEYRIHLLRLRADESQKVQLDSSYVPTPILEKRLTHSFRVSSSTSVKYVPGCGCCLMLNFCCSDMLIFLKEVGFF